MMTASGQHRAVNIDSVRRLVQVGGHDSSSLNNMLYLTYLQEAIAPGEALAYADTVRALAPGLPFDEAYFKTYYLKAKVFNRQGRLDLARDELLAVIGEPNLMRYPDVACDCYRALGENYFLRFQYETAIDYYLKSIEIGRPINDFGCFAGNFYNLGGIYFELGNYPMALNYYLKARDLTRYGGRPNMLAYDYRGIASVTPDTAYARVALDSALIYANLSNNPFEVRRTYIEYAQWARELGLLEEALAHYRSALEIELDREMSIWDAIAYMEAAVLSLQNGQPEAADRYYRISRDLTGSLQQAPGEVHYYFDKALYLELTGRTAEAIDAYKDYIAVADSVFDRTMTGIVADKDARFRIAESEAKIQDQKAKLGRQTALRQRLVIGGIFLILLLLLLFQWIYLRQKRKKRSAEYELELQRTETDALRRLDELKTRFFANVSHELRTPLTLILGPLEQAVGKVNGKPVREDLETALRNGNRLHELINSILDFSKIEQGELGLVKQATPAAAFFRRIVSSFDSVAHMNRIDLDFRTGLPETEFLLLDRDKMEKILVNLVGNAFKFTPMHGKIEVSVDREGDHLRIDVTDNGPGIPPDDLPHIFERFYQSRHEDRIKQGGTGIGLALSHDLVELMEGRITVDSTPGQGATFSVVLPYEGANEPADGSAEAPGGNGQSGHLQDAFEPLFVSGAKPRVLIVDDNTEMCRYIRGLLERHYDCTVAHDGISAFDMLQSQAFDLVTCDVMMPHMDGFELREKLNATGISDQVPFIMVTARALEEDIVHGLRLGVDDYITKPFNARELQARVYNLIQNRIERANQPAVDPDETGPGITSVKTQLLKEIEAVVLENIAVSEFKVEDLAEKLNYSRRQLGRIVKKEVGLTLVGYVLEIRLQKARILLEQQAYATVREVQFAVGIESASYFSSKFYQRFGKRPNEYLA